MNNCLRKIKETLQDDLKLIQGNPTFIIACEALTLLIKCMTEMIALFAIKNKVKNNCLNYQRRYAQ